MQRLALLTVALLLGLRGVTVEATGAPQQPEAVETYAVVVNANNPSKETGDAAKKTVKALFLKELTRWSDGVEAKPYDRDAKAPEHSAFLQEVLGMTPAELARQTGWPGWFWVATHFVTIAAATAGAGWLVWGAVTAP